MSFKHYFTILLAMLSLSSSYASKGFCTEDSVQQKLTGVSILDENFDRMQLDLDFANSTNRQQFESLWDASFKRNPSLQYVSKKLSARELSDIVSQRINSLVNPITKCSNSYPVAFLGSSSEEARLRMDWWMLTQQIDILFKSFRAYKANLPQYFRIEQSLRIASSVPKTQTEAQKLERNYKIHKAQRDLAEIKEDLRANRAVIKELSGAEALATFDKQINDELINNKKE